MIRTLLPCQTIDPARGSFMVNPMPVKDAKGRVVTKQGHAVYRSAVDIRRARDGTIINTVAHPESFDFIII